MKSSKPKPYLKPSEPQSGMIVILKPETDLKRCRFGGFKSFFKFYGVESTHGGRITLLELIKLNLKMKIKPSK
jgi:hypothetical protein